MEKRITESGKSYWDNNGAYQTEYDKLYEDLVPSRGEADTIHGEMIRATSRLFYDFCNNGNCNVIDVNTESCPDCYGSGYEEYDCCSCDGSGEVECGEDEFEDCYECEGSGIEYNDCPHCGGECSVETDTYITDYYFDMIKFLKRHLNTTDVVVNLVKFLEDENLGYSSYTFSDSELKVYNDLVDEVMHQVLTTENQKRIAIS
jgi:hypothetical protein